MEQKRLSGRAIVYFEDKIVSMYRERDGRQFYTFPGGGMDEGETEQECVAREVLEEFGMTVKPIKKVYIYDSPRSIEHFYICEWISGEFGSGVGEEFQADRNRGLYKPTLIDIDQIPTLPLMPPEIATAFVQDYKTYGKMLGQEVKTYYRTDK